MGYCVHHGDDTMKRSTSAFIIYFGVIICTLLLRVAFNLGFASGSEIGNDVAWTLLGQVGIFGIMPFALYFLTNKKGDMLEVKSVFADFGFKKTSGENLALTIPITILLMFVVTCVVTFYSIFLKMIGYTRSSAEVDYYNIGILFEQLVLVAVLPAFFEEFTHRGLLFAGLKDATNKPVILIVLSSVLFALMHQNIQQVLYTCIAGSVMGLVTYYSGSIWGGMLVHFINNGLYILEEFLYQKSAFFKELYDRIFNMLTGTLFGWMIGFTMFAGSVVAIVFMLRHMRSKGKEKGILLDKENAKAFTPIDIAVITTTILVGAMATILSLVWGIMR